MQAVHEALAEDGRMERLSCAMVIGDFPSELELLRGRLAGTTVVDETALGVQAKSMIEEEALATGRRSRRGGGRSSFERAMHGRIYK